MKEITIALIGNPNVGKTVLFNALTGAKQHVGNWPGVTVEKKEGEFEHMSVKVHVVDLPGVYSLSAQSIDEKIARDYIIRESPDLIVDIVDASNLERNLYLLLQLVEIHPKVIVALNMMDEAKKRGYKIDVKKLESFLGVPIVPTIAIKNVGIDTLKDKIVKYAFSPPRRRIEIGYGKLVEKAILQIESELKKRGEKCLSCPFSNLCLKSDRERRWVATRLLEGDEEVEKNVDKNVLNFARRVRENLSKKIGDISAYMAEKRYEIIGEVVHQCVKGEIKETLTDKIDRVVLSRAFGIPIFIIIMWMAFKITFDLASPFVDAVDVLFGYLSDFINNSISDPTIASLLADGIVGGLGSILVFVPNIFMMFFVLSLLEDSGYLSRAAFLMDKIMYKIGLQGKSFIPLLLGFGCNVPAIMATRTIEDEKDRIITILVNPLITCSARLPVYVLFASVFFPGIEANIIVSMYLLSILLAVLIAFLLRKFLFKGKASPFIMEMPPYRFPTLKSTSIHMWNRGVHFIKKAGTIIFLGSIVVWALSYYPSGNVEDSYIAILGRYLQPIFSPLGWSWKAVAALFFGFIAKEIVVSTFGILYGVEEEKLVSENSPLFSEFSSASAYAYMAFVLIYTPCLATLATIWQETGKFRWVIFTIVYEIVLAYSIALLISLIGGLII